MTLDEAINKARKLLNLADSDNPNEAAAAAAQAQKILDKYEITQTMVEQSGEEEPDDEDIAVFRDSPLHEATKFNLDKWRIRLADVISEANMCQVLLNTNSNRNVKQIIIVGRPSDAEKVRYIFQWMFEETERLCKRDGRGKGRTWRNNYRHGVVDTITKKLRQVREEAIAELKEANSSTALIKVDNALKKMEQRIHKVVNVVNEATGGKTDSDSRMTPEANARRRGREAGEEINVNTKARGALKS